MVVIRPALRGETTNLKVNVFLLTKNHQDEDVKYQIISGSQEKQKDLADKIKMRRQSKNLLDIPGKNYIINSTIAESSY